jgi:23S rRNA G2069 N7-methylase RlmK/C1962 C5-methylase RlmI
MDGTAKKTGAQAQMLLNRLKKRLSHLRKWAKRTGTTAFRLYDRDIPEIPLVLDLYGDMVSGALYKRPYEKDEAEETAWLEKMRDAAAGAAGIERDNVIIKNRERQRGQAQYEKMAARGLTRIVCENGIKFRVNLSDYLDTGLFLDKRATRRLSAGDSGGKRVLNLFCYTGSFSVYAAAGGASETDSVDLSNTYLNRAKDNFALNNFSAQALRQEEFFALNAPGAGHRLIRADVYEFLRRAIAAKKRWDTVILDPPAFSNSTMAGDFDLKRDYAAVLADCLTLLMPGGKLWFSASARSFKTGAAEIEAALANQFPGVKIANIGPAAVDEDFRGKRIPKTYILTRGPANA